MILENSDNNLFINSLTELVKLKRLFYEILNLYSIKSFINKENLAIFNRIIKSNKNKDISIELFPEKLISELEINLISLNVNLEEINSLKYSPHTNKAKASNKSQNFIGKKHYLFENFIDKFMKYTFIWNNYFYFQEEKYTSNPLVIFEENYFYKLIEKYSLIGMYFNKIKIQYNIKSKNNKEFIQIKIIFHNLFIVCILFPFTLNMFYQKDFHKKFKIIVNGIYGPKIFNIYDDNYNNYSNYKLYKKMAKIFNNKFREIIQNEIENKEEKISFYKVFAIFVDYIYDYDKIFKIKCQKCFNKLKYNFEEKYFSIPCYKILNIDRKYIKILIDKIDEGNNNCDKTSFSFFHEECSHNF